MTAAEWFFLQNRKQAGPFTGEQIRSLFTAATIHETTLVWRPGCTDWTPLSNFAELNGQPRQPPISPAAEKAAVVANIAKASVTTMQSPADERGAPPPLVSANGWVDETPHPWRRYFARALDNFFWGILLMFLVGIALALYDPQMAADFSDLFEGPGGRVADIVLSFILCMIPNAILIGLTGGNFGKWLFGICVLDQEDRPIGLLRALQREIRVLVYGLGFGIPIVTLITSVAAYQSLKADGVTSWDRALNLKIVQRRTGPVQYIGATVGIVVLIGLFVLLLWLNTA